VLAVIDSELQLSMILARKARELEVYSQVVPHNVTKEQLSALEPEGIVISGSPDPLVCPDVSDLIERGILDLGIPVVCVNCKAPGVPSIHYVPGSYEWEQAFSEFLFSVCSCRKDWTVQGFIERSIKEIKSLIGDGRAISGLSGGVDSSVASRLVQEAIGDRLTCIFVDTGLLRKGEPDDVRRIFGEGFKMNLKMVDASERFLTALKGITDPEEKRKIIGGEFINVFQDEAAKLRDEAGFLVQGTLYSDVLESQAHAGTGGSRVKSHHNVGGLPETVQFELVEPLRYLFKDEVRAIGRELGIPHHILDRHPFPGPGFGVRIVGEINEESLEIAREANAIVEEEIRRAGLYNELWQAFAVVLDIRSVGVSSGMRTYERPVVVRVVTGHDGMTCDWGKLPYEVMEKISSRITHEVKGVNRVVYDITPKPPGTIEWE
jgi:GMP synthase (glutamine-hydrolysing)